MDENAHLTEGLLNKEDELKGILQNEKSANQSPDEIQNLKTKIRRTNQKIDNDKQTEKLINPTRKFKNFQIIKTINQIFPSNRMIRKKDLNQKIC